MTSADTEAADRLRELVGFNQSVDDWCDLLGWEPDGCFVGQLGQRTVGTVTTTAYGTSLAWIGMMLVDPGYRRAGIGRQLMTQALEVLAHVDCVALDATTLGRTLYDQLGFVEVGLLWRWDGTVVGGRHRPRPIRNLHVQAATDSDLPTISRLDHDASGVDRERILRRLVEHPRAKRWKATRAGALVAFAMARPATRGYTVGPVVAREPSAAVALTEAVLRSMDGQQVALDVWDSSPLLDLLAAYGLQQRRSLTRMSRGQGLPRSSGAATYVIASPQTG